MLIFRSLVHLPAYPDPAKRSALDENVRATFLAATRTPLRLAATKAMVNSTGKKIKFITLYIFSLVGSVTQKEKMN